MIAAGIGLLAMAVGGAVAGGLTRDVGDPKRVVRGVLASVLVVGIGSLAFDINLLGFVLVAVLAGFPLVVSGAMSRLIESRQSLAWLSLSMELGCALLLVLLPGIPGAAVGADGTWLGSFVSRLQYPDLATLSPGTLVLFVGVVAWLGPVGNGIVRMLLTAAGADTVNSEARLRGGRVIGILERWLIFGFVVSGHATAAAFIVSAKSILRFPELSEKARHDSNDEDDLNSVTEYLLLGSLASWTLAVLPTVLFR